MIRFEHFRFTARPWIRALSMAALAVLLMGAKDCCCDDILEDLTENYDYVRNWSCESTSGGSGCIEVDEGEAHIEIESGHKASFDAACKYEGRPDDVALQVGFQTPAGTQLASDTLYFNFNGEAISFMSDPTSALELEDTFGGNWVAYQQVEPVTPSRDTDPDTMDQGNFGYRLVHVAPLPPDGVPLPATFTYAKAVKDPNTEEWVYSETTNPVDWSQVVVTITDSDFDFHPYKLGSNEPLELDSIWLKNTGDVLPAGALLEAVIEQDGAEVERQTLEVLDELPPWATQQLQGYAISLANLSVGHYAVSVAVEMPGGERLGRKYFGLEVTNDGSVTAVPMSRPGA